MSRLWLAPLAAAAVAVLPVSAPAAALSVMDWNVANHSNDAADDSSLAKILSYAGSSRLVDLITLAETDMANNSVNNAAAAAEAVFGGTYASLVTEPDGGGDRNGFVYNTATLSVVGSPISVGVGSLTHPALRVQFRPAGTSGPADFYAYAVHLDSGSSTTIKQRRVAQAQVLRGDLDALGPVANSLVAGYFNWQKADDVSRGVGAYRTLSAAGTAQAIDVVGQVDDWRANPAYRSLLTNDPGSNLDDRFDMQLMSRSLLDGRNLDYVAGSYRVLGNNGSIAVGGTVYDDTSLPAGLAAAFDDFSAHLPVLAGYRCDIPGDADGDSDVDFNDFVLLQSNFGRGNAAFAQGDFDYNGVVTFDDFVLLQSNFGFAVGGLTSFTRSQYAAVMGISDASQVPEPAAVAITGLSAAGLLRRRRANT